MLAGTSGFSMCINLYIQDSTSLQSWNDHPIRLLVVLPGQAPPPKLGDYSSQEAVTIQAAQRQVVLDMITTRGWIKNATKAERTDMHAYTREVINSLKPRYDGSANFLVMSDVTTLVIQALTKDWSRLAATMKKSIHNYHKYLKPQDNSLSPKECKAYMNVGKNRIYDSSQLHTYFLHGHIDGRLVMFSADAVWDTLICHYFADKLSPLYDEFLRKLLTKDELHMLSMVAVGVRYVNVNIFI
ncbi:hypothetical protein F4604DRAFT_1694102 [Suillus subluteus]|nr:hypothetical protein F4604DRAFT_1694102 [Suillus subluteus]